MPVAHSLRKSERQNAQQFSMSHLIVQTILLSHLRFKS